MECVSVWATSGSKRHAKLHAQISMQLGLDFGHDALQDVVDHRFLVHLHVFAHLHNLLLRFVLDAHGHVVSAGG